MKKGYDIGPPYINTANINIGHYPGSFSSHRKKKAENFTYKITKFLIAGNEISTLSILKVPTGQLPVPYTSHRQKPIYLTL